MGVSVYCAFQYSPEGENDLWMAHPKWVTQCLLRSMTAQLIKAGALVCPLRPESGQITDMPRTPFAISDHSHRSN